MSVVTATWIIAIIQLIIVVYVWLMGALYFFAVTDTKDHTQFDSSIAFSGA
jgi:hypothetical protein